MFVQHLSSERLSSLRFSPGAHFNKLLKNYGSPIVAVNLVKKKEKKRQESQLSEEYSFAIQNLNMFLPPPHAIRYIALDMARINKLLVSEEKNYHLTLCIHIII
jgi:hypothetical protein